MEGLQMIDAWVEMMNTKRINAYTEQGAKWKKCFHSEGKRILKTIANMLGLQPGTYDIRSNQGGIAVSGEVTLHGEHIYIQFYQGGMGNQFMYRSCKGRGDYTGGDNHWMKWDDLLDLPRACKLFKEV
jgi:hypothetical protein